MKSRENFKPFTLVHPEKGTFVRFEPTDDPDMVFARFKGSCNHVMENLLDFDVMVEQTAFLLGKGYVEQDEPEGSEQRFLHDLDSSDGV